MPVSAENYRSLKIASWLGWQIESNWADPFLFAVYSIVRPIASTLILVFMYLVVPKSNQSADLFAFIYIGNAFFMYVGNVLYGIGWVIHEDREHYQMLKYVYISPARMYYFLFGRGVAKLIATTLAVIITLAFGIIFLHLNISLAKIDYPLLIFSLLVGLFIITCLGIILAGVSLLTAHHSFYLTEGVAGLFYLLCGAVFPLSVLPDWLQTLAKGIPLTYWLELTRRAIMGKSLSGTLDKYINLELIGIMLITTLFLALFSNYIYKFFEFNARKRGLIDRITSY